MNYSSHEYNILSYLLGINSFNYYQTIEWAYAQYTDQGIDSFIEKIGLALDKKDILELIANEYQVYGEPGSDFLIGEVAHQYFTSELSLVEAVQKILYRLDVDLLEKETQAFYLADDFYGWHARPDDEAEKLLEPILKKYQRVYEREVGKFSI